MGVSERVLLRLLGDSGRDANAAVDLNSTNFDDMLKSSPTSYAIVQFFAHWIASMCRANKPGKLDGAPQYDMDVELNGLMFSVVCLLNFLTAGDKASTLVPADSCCPSRVKNLTM